MGKSLTRDQNERVREWLRLLLEREGNQTRAARLLEVSSATISRINSGAQGASVHLVQALAKQLGRDAVEVLDPGALSEGKLQVVERDPRYPSSFAAQKAALLLGCSAEDVRSAISQHDSAEDPGDTYWILEFLRVRDRRRRREGPPAGRREG